MLAQSEKQLKDMVLAHYQPSGNQTEKSGSQEASEILGCCALAAVRQEVSEGNAGRCCSTVQQRKERKAQPEKVQANSQEQAQLAKKVSQKTFTKNQAKHTAAAAAVQEERDTQDGPLTGKAARVVGADCPAQLSGVVVKCGRQKDARHRQVRAGVRGSSRDRCAGEAVRRQLGLHRSG